MCCTGGKTADIPPCVPRLPYRCCTCLPLPSCPPPLPPCPRLAHLPLPYPLVPLPSCGRSLYHATLHVHSLPLLSRRVSRAHWVAHFLLDHPCHQFHVGRKAPLRHRSTVTNGTPRVLPLFTGKPSLMTRLHSSRFLAFISCHGAPLNSPAQFAVFSAHSA